MNMGNIFHWIWGTVPLLKDTSKRNNISVIWQFTVFFPWYRAPCSPGYFSTFYVAKYDTEFLSSCICLPSADIAGLCHHILPIWFRAWDPGLPICKHSTSELQQQLWEFTFESLSPWQEGGFRLPFPSFLSSPSLPFFAPCLPSPPPLSPSSRAEVFFKSATLVLVSSLTTLICSTYFCSSSCVPWLFSFSMPISTLSWSTQNTTYKPLTMVSNSNRNNSGFIPDPPRLSLSIMLFFSSTGTSFHHHILKVNLYLPFGIMLITWGCLCHSTTSLRYLAHCVVYIFGSPIDLENTLE